MNSLIMYSRRDQTLEYKLWSSIPKGYAAQGKRVVVFSEDQWSGRPLTVEGAPLSRLVQDNKLVFGSRDAFQNPEGAAFAQEVGRLGASDVVIVHVSSAYAGERFGNDIADALMRLWKSATTEDNGQPEFLAMIVTSFEKSQADSVPAEVMCAISGIWYFLERRGQSFDYVGSDCLNRYFRDFQLHLEEKLSPATEANASQLWRYSDGRWQVVCKSSRYDISREDFSDGQKRVERTLPHNQRLHVAPPGLEERLAELMKGEMARLGERRLPRRALSLPIVGGACIFVGLAFGFVPFDATDWPAVCTAGSCQSLSMGLLLIFNGILLTAVGAADSIYAGANDGEYEFHSTRGIFVRNLTVVVCMLAAVCFLTGGIAAPVVLALFVVSVGIDVLRNTVTRRQAPRLKYLIKQAGGLRKLTQPR